MELDRFTHTVRSFIREQPYRCFELELADHRVVPVHNPESFAFLNGRGVVIGPRGEVCQFTHENVVSIRPGCNTVEWMI